MKKVFLVMAFAAMLFAAGQAQAQIIYAGYTPETFSSENSAKNYQGFCVGFNTDFDLTKNLGVAVGAQFRMNMRSTKGLNGALQTKETQTIVDVPILLNYNFGINNRMDITPFVGPMLSLGITGNTNTKTYVGSLDSNWYGEDGYMRRFNLYGMLGANFSISDFNVFAGYRFGFLDLDKSDYVKMTTNGFFVGVGFEL